MTKASMYFLDPPENFNPSHETAGCFVEHEGEILMLLRQDHKSYGGYWGQPAGKVEKGEKKHKTIVREIKEETQIDPDPKLVKFFKTLYVRYPEYDFIYHIFHYPLKDKVDVKIDEKEHKDFLWLTPKEVLNIKFVPEVDSCIKLFYGI